MISKAERNRRALAEVMQTAAPYPQQYVITLESGAVALASVMAGGRDAGQAAAKALTLETFKGQAFWALAAYPWNGDRGAFVEGVHIIKTAPKVKKPAPAKRQPRLIVEYRGVNMYRKTSPGYALPWSCNCNGVNLSADTQAGLREMIRDSLDSDKIMGAM